MTCVQVKSMLSAYLDGAISGRQMYVLDQHLRICAGCAAEYRSLERTQALLSRLGRAKAPEDLSLKLRLAISREAARRQKPVWGNLLLHSRTGCGHSWFRPRREFSRPS